MKTDPYQFGSKVSKIESPQKVGTNFLLNFFLSPLTLAEKIKWNQITMKKCDERAHLCGGRHRAAALGENRTWDGTAAGLHVGGHLQSPAAHVPHLLCRRVHHRRTLHPHLVLPVHARRGRGGAFDPLYLSHETTGAHSSNTNAPSPHRQPHVK
jgi:hypothetical protein